MMPKNRVESTTFLHFENFWIEKLKFRSDFIIHVFETASTNYWQYIFGQNFANHQILIRSKYLEYYLTKPTIRAMGTDSFGFFSWLLVGNFDWKIYSFYIQNNIINRYIIQVMILFCFDETLQFDKKKDQLTVSIRIKNMVLFIFAPYMIGRCPRFVVFRLSRTRNIQEHMIRIYLVVVNCELIDRAGLNNPQLWDTQKSLCSRFSNVPSSAYKVLTKPFMPFSIFKNIGNSKN